MPCRWSVSKPVTPSNIPSGNAVRPFCDKSRFFKPSPSDANKPPGNVASALFRRIVTWDALMPSNKPAANDVRLSLSSMVTAFTASSPAKTPAGNAVMALSYIRMVPTRLSPMKSPGCNEVKPVEPRNSTLSVNFPNWRKVIVWQVVRGSPLWMSREITSLTTVVRSQTDCPTAMRNITSARAPLSSVALH